MLPHRILTALLLLTVLLVPLAYGTHHRIVEVLPGEVSGWVDDFDTGDRIHGFFAVVPDRGSDFTVVFRVVDNHEPGETVLDFGTLNYTIFAFDFTINRTSQYRLEFNNRYVEGVPRVGKHIQLGYEIIRPENPLWNSLTGSAATVGVGIIVGLALYARGYRLRKPMSESPPLAGKMSQFKLRMTNIRPP